MFGVGMVEKASDVENLEVSMIDSVAKSESLNAGVEWAEIAFDAFVEDGLLKDVPIFGTLTKVVKSGMAIRDRIFLRKVHAFLCELDNASMQERDAFVRSVEREKGGKEKAGAALMLLLDKLDDIDKPELIGRIYLAKIKGQISYGEMRRYCMFVERVYLPDLIELGKLEEGETVDDTSAPLFASLGIVSMTGEDYGTFDGIGAQTWYEVNDTGKKFLSVILPGST